VSDPRHRVRILAAQCLCHLDAQGDASLPLLGRIVAGLEADGQRAMQGEALARAAWKVRAELDAQIARSARNWSLSRMPPVDRNIIRLGAYEILYCPDVPRAVAIDEAVRLAKRFGTEDSPAFVNGVLDALPGRSGSAGREAGEEPHDE
jgi:N utilization substance protein B